MLFGSGFVIHAVAWWWLRAKQLERGDRPAITSTLPAIEARLARIEDAVEAVAVEVERLGEAHRFAVGLLPTSATREAKPATAPQRTEPKGT
jgi:hypothetical protein